jgi:small subunit ribosomal protein S6
MYETIFILDSLLTPEEIDKIIDRVKEIVESNNGKILTVDKWGKRRLAYEIQKKQYGFYVAIEFESEGEIPNLLEREYNFNDKILRYLTYRYTKNKIKARAKEMEQKKYKKEDIEANGKAESTDNGKQNIPAKDAPVETVPVEEATDEQKKEEEDASKE